MSRELVRNSSASLRPVTAVYVSTAQGMGLVEAQVHGSFALHGTVVSAGAAIAMPGMEWSITHVASGRNLALAATEADGVALIAELNALGFDWDFRDPRALRTWPQDHADRVRAIIEHHGCMPPKAATALQNSSARH